MSGLETRDRMVAADLRADSQATVPPAPMAGLEPATEWSLQISECFPQATVPPTPPTKNNLCLFWSSGSSGMAVGYQQRGPGFDSHSGPSEIFIAPLCPPSTKKAVDRIGADVLIWSLYIASRKVTSGFQAHARPVRQWQGSNPRQKKNADLKARLLSAVPPTSNSIVFKKFSEKDRPSNRDNRELRDIFLMNGGKSFMKMK
ncbi:hypothetical protein PoB_003609600 [Plakobranchus ocellatus]|uniref:Uncharacterized protein n=1 Tax=Plakobranchus ocellatus TaxID=259542 RepID=A0AAV4AN28_9GAST|nr:hypothetical protein PoB_003609600 [Plakobranchus ocellatus]